MSQIDYLQLAWLSCAKSPVCMKILCKKGYDFQVTLSDFLIQTILICLADGILNYINVHTDMVSSGVLWSPLYQKADPLCSLIPLCNRVELLVRCRTIYNYITELALYPTNNVGVPMWRSTCMCMHVCVPVCTCVDVYMYV